jgi:hypothetical protein
MLAFELASHLHLESVSRCKQSCWFEIYQNQRKLILSIRSPNLVATIVDNGGHSCRTTISATKWSEIRFSLTVLFLQEWHGGGGATLDGMTLVECVVGIAGRHPLLQQG